MGCCKKFLKKTKRDDIWEDTTSLTEMEHVLLDLEPQTWVKFHKRFRNASRFVVCTWPFLPKATVQWSCINYSKMIHWYMKVHTNWNEIYIWHRAERAKKHKRKPNTKTKMQRHSMAEHVLNCASKLNVEVWNADHWNSCLQVGICLAKRTRCYRNECNKH